MEAAIIALNYIACVSIFYNTLQYSTTHIQRLLRNRTIIEILQERKLAIEHKVHCYCSSTLAYALWSIHPGGEIPICKLKAPENDISFDCK